VLIIKKYNVFRKNLLLLLTILYLLYLNNQYFYFSGWKPLTLSVVCLSVAMLCKEQGITIAGVCVLYEVFVAQKVKFSS
jgi:hypothetical protein